MSKKIGFGGLLVLFIMSCNDNERFAHCIFNDNPSVKGHFEWVKDSTIYFPGGDSLSNDTLFDFRKTFFPDPFVSSHSGAYFYDTNDVDFVFDIMGKFSRDRLISQYDINNLTQNKVNYNHHSLYNTEDDYFSSATGAVYLKYKYKYNESCNLLQFDQMNEDSSVEKIYAFQYNDEHNLIECKVYNGSKLLLKEVKYGYDKYNNEIGYTIYDNIKKLNFNFSFTYHEYDTIGNWQKRVKYKNNKPVAITQRHVKYF